MVRPCADVDAAWRAGHIFYAEGGDAKGAVVEGEAPRASAGVVAVSALSDGRPVAGEPVAA